MKKVLFFTAWFPDKVDTLAGNFVLEHAKCLKDKVELAIFHVRHDFNLGTWLKFERFELKGIEIYQMSFRRFKHPAFYPINIFSYLIANIKGYLYLKKKFGIADINHVHVLTKTAILPFFLKLIYKTPFVISEHWSRYLPERNTYHGTVRKWITKKIVNSSSGLFTVSQDLMNAMGDHGLRHKNSMIISNTITDDWFANFEKIDNKIFKFLHVSGIQDSIKNVTGILRAASNLKKIGLNFSLDIIGDDAERPVIESYANSLLLDDCVIFHGKLYGEDLRKKYQESDAFVLFSNFENQPCVLLESFACGLPVIATDVGGIPEIVNENNGILVNAKDEDALICAMKTLILGDKSFDNVLIKKEAKQKHSYQAVSKKIIEFYEVALNK